MRTGDRGLGEVRRICGGVLVLLWVGAQLPTQALAAAGQVTRLRDSGPQDALAKLSGLSGADIAAVTYADHKVVTAVRAANGALKLITWRVGADGISRLRDSGQQAGAASRITLGRVASDMLVTALRDGSGKLKLITWRIGPDDTVTRLRDSGSQAGAVGLIALVRCSNGVWITAVTNAKGELRLIPWEISPNGQILRGDGDGYGGPAKIVTLTSLDHRFVAAVRTANGKLKLIAGSVGPIPYKAPPYISRDGYQESDAQAGAVSEISLQALTKDRVVTAVRTAGGGLKLIAWKVLPHVEPQKSGFPEYFEREGDSGEQAGAATLISLGRMTGVDMMVTAVRDANGKLKMITWRIESAGAVKRLGDSGNQAGAIDGTAIALSEASPGTWVTAVRDGSGKLKLIVWSIDSGTPGTPTRVDKLGVLGPKGGMRDGSTSGPGGTIRRTFECTQGSYQTGCKANKCTRAQGVGLHDGCTEFSQDCKKAGHTWTPHSEGSDAGGTCSVKR